MSNLRSIIDNLISEKKLKDHTCNKRINRCFMTGKQCSFINITSSDDDSIFVIMPYRKNFDNLYEWAIKKYFGEYGISEDKIIRADQTCKVGYIICKRVCLKIQLARLVVVDISAVNPNVFYELGLASGLNKPLVIFCQKDKFNELQPYLLAVGIDPEKVLVYSEISKINKEHYDITKYITQIDYTHLTPQKQISTLIVNEDIGKNNKIVQEESIKLVNKANLQKAAAEKTDDISSDFFRVAIETSIKQSISTIVENKQNVIDLAIIDEMQEAVETLENFFNIDDFEIKQENYEKYIEQFKSALRLLIKNIKKSETIKQFEKILAKVEENDFKEQFLDKELKNNLRIIDIKELEHEKNKKERQLKNIQNNINSIRTKSEEINRTESGLNEIIEEKYLKILPLDILYRLIKRELTLNNQKILNFINILSQCDDKNIKEKFSSEIENLVISESEDKKDLLGKIKNKFKYIFEAEDFQKCLIPSLEKIKEELKNLNDKETFLSKNLENLIEKNCVEWYKNNLEKINQDEEEPFEIKEELFSQLIKIILEDSIEKIHKLMKISAIKQFTDSKSKDFDTNLNEEKIKLTDEIYKIRKYIKNIINETEAFSEEFKYFDNKCTENPRNSYKEVFYVRKFIKDNIKEIKEITTEELEKNIKFLKINEDIKLFRRVFNESLANIKNLINGYNPIKSVNATKAIEDSVLAAKIYMIFELEESLFQNNIPAAEIIFLKLENNVFSKIEKTLKRYFEENIIDIFSNRHKLETIVENFSNELNVVDEYIKKTKIFLKDIVTEYFNNKNQNITEAFKTNIQKLFEDKDFNNFFTNKELDKENLLHKLMSLEENIECICSNEINLEEIIESFLKESNIDEKNKKENGIYLKSVINKYIGIEFISNEYLKAFNDKFSKRFEDKNLDNFFKINKDFFLKQVSFHTINSAISEYTGFKQKIEEILNNYYLNMDEGENIELIINAVKLEENFQKINDSIRVIMAHIGEDINIVNKLQTARINLNKEKNEAVDFLDNIESVRKFKKEIKEPIEKIRHKSYYSSSLKTAISILKQNNGEVIKKLGDIKFFSIYDTITNNFANYIETRNIVNSSFVCIIDLLDQNAISYFWLGYCHSRTLNVVPIYRKSTNTRNADILAFDIRSLWYLDYDKYKTSEEFLKIFKAIFEELIEDNIVNEERNTFWSRLTDSSNKVLIQVGGFIDRGDPVESLETVKSWDLKVASELIRYISSSDQPIFPTLQSPVFPPENVFEVITQYYEIYDNDKNNKEIYSEKLENSKRKTRKNYIKNAKMMLEKTQNHLIIGSPDVNPVIEIILEEAYKKDLKEEFSFPLTCSYENFKNWSKDIIGLKYSKTIEEGFNGFYRYFVQNQKSLSKFIPITTGDEEDYMKKTELSAKLYDIITELKRGKRGYLVDNEPLLLQYHSMDDTNEEFKLLGHLLILKNIFRQDKDGIIIILNGISGPANLALAEVLTGSFNNYKKERKSEQMLKKINELWSKYILEANNFNGLEALIEVIIDPNEYIETYDDISSNINLNQIIHNNFDDRRGIECWDFYDPYKIRMDNPRPIPE